MLGKFLERHNQKGPHTAISKRLISKIAQNQIQPHKFCLQTRIAKYKNTKREFIGMFTSVQEQLRGSD